jgi:hypothetical protein
MPDKARERFYLEKLREIIDLPSGPVDEPEPPDFLLISNGRRLGIELTDFYLPPSPGERPHQEQQSLKDRIVEIAERIHSEAAGPALYVSVCFDPHSPLAKTDIQPLAHMLAESVLHYPVPRSIKDPAVEFPWGYPPKGISAILVHGSVDGKDRLWDTDAGGWVASITPGHVAKYVTAKARREPLARSRCDELWLVIVNDPFLVRAAPAEFIDEAREVTYEGPFDRLIWLLPHIPRAFDLQCHALEKQ